MAFELLNHTLSVEYNDTFSISYSGSTGVVSASVGVFDSTRVSNLKVIDNGDGTGVITGELTIIASVGSTITVTATDTYLVDGVETTSTDSCAITVVTDGIIADLDDESIGQTVFARQQALCDNQVLIAKKVNTVRNFVIGNLAVSVVGLAKTIKDVNDVLNELGTMIAALPEQVEETTVKHSKNVVSYGE
jgi:hypothetical protein